MSRVDVAAFQPNVRGCVRIDATSASAATQINLTTGLLNQHVVVWNSGTVGVAVEAGNSSVTATVPAVGTPGSHVIAPGTTQTLRLNGSYLAAITISGTATLYVTPGEGT